MRSEITEKALKGELFNHLEIIDSHCHMGPWYNFYFPQAGIEEMLEDADKVGVQSMCIAPHAAISCDYKLGNLQVSETAKKYPGRVLGLLTLNPHKPEEIDGEFSKYYNASSFIGVKVHPGLHECSVLDDNYFKVYQRVGESGGYVLGHSWETNPFCGIDMYETVIRSFPEIPFVLAHAGGTRTGIFKSIKVVNKYENAYMDTSGFEFSDTWIEEIVEKEDISKILFGSDCPFHDLRGGISRILFADIEDRIKQDILSKNYRKLLAKWPKKV